MFAKCHLLNCDVEIDNEQTAQWYAQAEDWGCECGNCLNFLAVTRQGLLPSYITTLLEKLHIPPTKATYVCLLDGEHLYQFSYRIAGNILSVQSEWDRDGRCCHEEYFTEAPGFPTPHFDLEFMVELPWILDENNSEQ